MCFSLEWRVSRVCARQALVVWSHVWEELPCCVCAPWLLRRSYADRLEDRKCAPGFGA